MKQSIAHITLVVRDYDEAIRFYVDVLGFELIDDTFQPEQNKRWVLVRPRGDGPSLLLGRATTPEQERAIGNQTGGRVFLFLDTDDFQRDYARLTSAGVKFVRPPSVQSYGTVAVFEDLYGNKWDLVQRTASEYREWSRGEYAISMDPARLDLGVIHGFLTESYWARGRSRERVARSIAESIPLGLYKGIEQVGFARVVSDRIVIAYLADVFVLEAHRGKGLGKWLVETAMTLPELATVRRWMLGTRDAHGLYRQLGFGDPKPGVLMERVNLESDSA
ncbi:MAG TPA: GNAT family N-acetyltransferase [Gemmatimonadaceae bacterium]